jgi:hypothetical protein
MSLDLGKQNDQRDTKMNDQQQSKMAEELFRYRTALAEARARIADLEKYIVDELLKKVQVK